MEKIGTADVRRHAHPTGERATCGKSLHIRVIRVIRGFHSRIQVHAFELPGYGENAAGVDSNRSSKAARFQTGGLREIIRW